MRSKLHQFVIVMENPGSRLSAFCFLIPSGLRLCVSALVSVLWDFLSFVCAQSCRNCPCFVFVHVLDERWPKLCVHRCRFYVVKYLIPTQWTQGFGSCMSTYTAAGSQRSQKDTTLSVFVFDLLLAHSAKSFQCGTGMQMSSFISALKHLAGSLLIFKEMEKDVQRCENKPRRPDEYSAHSSLTLR